MAAFAAFSVQVLEIVAGLDFGVGQPALKLSESNFLASRLKRPHIFEGLFDDFVLGHFAFLPLHAAAAVWRCWASLTNRTTLARLTPYFRATLVSDIPASRSRTRASRSTFRGARPSFCPSIRALRIPALMRSTIRDRSSSAIEPTSVINILPIGP